MNIATKRIPIFFRGLRSLNCVDLGIKEKCEKIIKFGYLLLNLKLKAG